MTPERDHKLFNIGCLIVSISMIASGLLAYFLNPAYVLACVCIIGLWFMVCKSRENRLGKLDEDAFQDAFGVLGDNQPRLDKRYSYTFPSYTVTFSSQELMEQAEADGLVDNFKASIQNLYGYLGSRSNPFDSDRSVFPTYEGRVYDVATISDE